MRKIDSRLSYLAAQSKKKLTELENTGRFPLEMVAQKPMRTRVLVEFSGSKDDLEKAGL